jgi:hypothetical protein
MKTYPAMLYRDGMLSGDPANQRTVHDADAELAAMNDGFGRWEKKPAGASVAGASSSGAADQAAFDQAAKRGGDDGEIDAAVEAVRGRRGGRK